MSVSGSLFLVKVICSLEPNLFGSVLFAGTFDHLHPGHKSVLTRALGAAKDSLHVGVTAGALLAKKVNGKALQTLGERTEEGREA